MSERARMASPRGELVGLLHAARQRPEDVTPRLIVADWLEEHGDDADLARAEFIRLQVQARLPPKTGGRPRALIALHAEAWLGPFADLGDAVSFERGMVALNVPVPRITGRAGAKLARGEAMFWLEKVELLQANDDAVVRLVESPLMPQIGNLVIAHANLASKAATALFRSTATTGLVALDLNNNRLSNLGVSALGGSPDLAGLRSLNLWLNRVGTRGAVALANTHHLHNLRHLNLAANSIRAEGLAALVGSRLMANVESLFVWYNDLRAAGAERLAQAPMVENLRTLAFESNQIGDEGAFFLAGSPTPRTTS